MFKGKDEAYINSFMASLTWNFFKGNETSKARNTLPDVKLLHPGMFKEFMKRFEENFHAKDDAGNWKTSSTSQEIQKSGLYSKLKLSNKTKDNTCITGG